MKGLINILLSVWVQVSPLPATINNAEDLLTARQLLLNAYENNDHEAFVEAFPSSYTDYYRLFYYKEEYEDPSFSSVDFPDYFLFGSDYFDPKIIDKLVSVSIGFRYYCEDINNLLLHSLRKYLNTYPQESALYLEQKEDAEIVSFFRMAFQALYPGNIWEIIMIVKKNLAKYSEKLIPLMKEAQKLALADNLKMIAEEKELVWW